MRADVVVVGAGLAGLRCAQVLAGARAATSWSWRPTTGSAVASAPTASTASSSTAASSCSTPPTPPYAAGSTSTPSASSRSGPASPHAPRPASTCSATRSAAPHSSRPPCARQDRRPQEVAALARWAAPLLRPRPGRELSDVLERRADVDRRTALDGAGVDGLLRRVVDRFFAGVLLEDDGSTADRFALLLTWMFVRGVPALPRDGMAAAAGAAGRDRSATGSASGRPVRRVTGTSVETDDGTWSRRPRRRRHRRTGGRRAHRRARPGDQGRRHRVVGGPRRARHRPAPRRRAPRPRPARSSTPPWCRAPHRRTRHRDATSSQGSALWAQDGGDTTSVDATPRRRPAGRRPGAVGGCRPPRGAARPPGPAGAVQHDAVRCGTGTSSSAATTATPARSRARSSAASAPRRPCCDRRGRRRRRPVGHRLRPRAPGSRHRDDASSTAVACRVAAWLPARLWDRRVDLGASYLTVSDPGFAAVVDDWAARGLAREWTDTFTALGGGTPDSKTGPVRWGAPHGLRSLVEDLADRPRRRATRGASAGGARARTPSSSPCPTRRPVGSWATTPSRDVLGREWEPVIAVAGRWSDRTWDGVEPDRPLRRRLRQRRPRRRVDRRRRPPPRRRRPGAGRPLDPRAGRAPPRRPGRRRARGGRRPSDACSTSASPQDVHVHRWTFARPTGRREEPYALVDGERLVGVCGDGWGETPKVETAWLSGVRLGRALAARLT